MRSMHSNSITTCSFWSWARLWVIFMASSGWAFVLQYGATAACRLHSSTPGCCDARPGSSLCNAFVHVREADISNEAPSTNNARSGAQTPEHLKALEGSEA